MEARPSVAVFFSFFRRVRERYPPLSSSSSSPSSSSSSSSSRFRDESTKGPRPRAEAERNETRFPLIRSTSSYPWCGTRTRPRTFVHACAHAYIRVYTYATHPRAFPLARTRAPLLRSRRFHPPRTPFSLPSRFILRQRPGEVCRRPLLILSRRSTASPAISLALLPCRFCVSHPLHARRPSHSFALRALSLEQPINSVGRRRVRTTILSLSSHRPTVLTPI